MVTKVINYRVVLLLKCIIIVIKSFSLRPHKFSLWGCRVMNERLKPEESKGELINSLSGSYCIKLTGLSRDEGTTQNPKTRN